MAADLALGFLTVVAIGVAPVLIVLTAVHARRIAGRIRVILMRLHLWRRPPVAPSGPPIEQLASDLRRLYPGAHFPRPGVRMPKQRGVLMAYDERLVDTARALGVTTHLTDCPLEGYDRAAERLRLELALADAGLVWRVDPAA